jgi:Cu-Zn family superoxide dismutase
MKRANPTSITALTLVAALASIGCERDRAEPDDGLLGREGASPAVTENDDVAEPREGKVTLKVAEGAEMDGTATLTEVSGGVKIVLEVDGALPGNKGVHIHETGNCDDIAGGSMGSHFAPKESQHALPSEGTAAERHLGDLGNLAVREDGSGRLEITVREANLVPDDTRSFLGRALVVHSGPDSGRTQQPAGGSGTPMACGVIERT